MEHSPPARPAPPASSALFVATDLDRFETSDSQRYAADVTICGRAYRRLDPPYYAWLRRQTASAKRALDTGRLPVAAFDAIRTAFNAVHTWAVRTFGEAALVAAAKSFDPASYQPPHPDDDDLPACGAQLLPPSPRDPSGFDFPAAGAWPFTEPVAADAVAKVDAVRDEALALGWTHSGLYQNRSHLRFPYGRDWGVIAFVTGDVAIAAVARDAITLQRPRGNALRFFNPAIPQPWRRPVADTPALPTAQEASA